MTQLSESAGAVEAVGIDMISSGSARWARSR